MQTPDSQPSTDAIARPGAVLRGAGLVLTALLLATASPVAAQRVGGTVVDAATGAPLAGAVVEVIPGGAIATSGERGGFLLRLEGAIESVRLRVERVGYLSLDTIVAPPGRWVLPLRPQPFDVDRLTVRVARDAPTRHPSREAFEAEVAPGTVVLTRGEIRGLPAVFEPDPVRALQGLPGVVSLNDLSAELYVRGGAADQTQFVLDGARVFGPYHMFGIFGAFNPLGTGDVRLYRAPVPSRLGGSLTSVVEVEAPPPGLHRGDVTAGLLSGSVGVRGRFGRRGHWSVGARRTWLDALVAATLPTEFPYAFGDVNATASYDPAPAHTLRVTGYGSDDRFRPIGDVSLTSRWSNRVGSATWEWAAPAFDLETTAAYSGYEAALVTGGEAGSESSNRVGLLQLRTVADWPGERVGFRAGAEVAAGGFDLEGPAEDAGFIHGRHRQEYRSVAVFGEADVWVGAVRLSPGLRISHVGRFEPEPRLGARVHVGPDVAVTVAASRSFQRISALRDGRLILPGPPFWIAHPDTLPSSTADNVTAQLDLWPDGAWHVELGGYARRFRDVVRWRPEGSRSLDGVELDDGHAFGAEVAVRKQVGRLVGWVSYAWSRVRLHTGAGVEYAPEWDRRHTADLAAIYRPGRGYTLSLRTRYGTGTPIRPFIGYIATPRFNGLTARPEIDTYYVPYWSERRVRLPDHFRMDVGARKRFEWGGVETVVFLNVTNATARPSVLYYKPAADSFLLSEASRLEPVPAWELNVLPTIGLEVRF